MTTPVDKRWTYCPECGSTEIRHAEGDHKQCACCLQEWFADIDYTDVVRTNLGNRMQLRSSLTAKDEHASAMRKAIVQAVEVIQVWHNMGMSGKVASDAWDIYWRNAPEMKPIREALKEA